MFRPRGSRGSPFEQQLALQGAADRGADRARPRRLGVLPRAALAGASSLGELAAQPFVTKEELLAAQAEDPPLGRARRRAAGGDHPAARHLGDDRHAAADRVHGRRPGAIVRGSGRQGLLFGGGTAARHDPALRQLRVLRGRIADHMSLEATGATVVPVGLGQATGCSTSSVAACRPGSSRSRRTRTTSPSARARRTSTRRDLGLRAIVTGGEPAATSPSSAARIEATWDARVADTYGLGDVWPTLGAQCEARDDFHLSTPDLLVTEPVDPETDRVLEWLPGATGELVYTHLDREASPLVRFRSRDRAEVLDARLSVRPRPAALPPARPGRRHDRRPRRQRLPERDRAAARRGGAGDAGFAVVLDEPIPVPPLRSSIEAGEIPDGLDRMIRERLQVQVAITALPPGRWPRASRRRSESGGATRARIQDGERRRLRSTARSPTVVFEKPGVLNALAPDDLPRLADALREAGSGARVTCLCAVRAVRSPPATT